MSNTTAASKVFVRWGPRLWNDPKSAQINNPRQLRDTVSPACGKGVATQVVPRWELLLPGEPVACDVEFQDYQVAGEVHPEKRMKGGKLVKHRKAGQPIWRQRLGWIGIVNTRCEIVLDVHVFYPEVPNTKIKMPSAPDKDFGVSVERLLPENGAVAGDIVEKWCTELFRDRIVVLHSGTNDLKSWYYEDIFAAAVVMDTQILERGEYEQLPGLATLAFDLLGETIQVGGVHGPVEDAVYTMKIYLVNHSYDRHAEAAKWQAVYRL